MAAVPRPSPVPPAQSRPEPRPEASGRRIRSGGRGRIPRIAIGLADDVVAGDLVVILEMIGRSDRSPDSGVQRPYSVS